MTSYISRSSNETFDFTDDEIRHELSKLGYNDIRQDQFEEFKRDLMTLVQAERSSSFSSQESPSDAKERRYDMNRIYAPVSGHKAEERFPIRGKENPDTPSSHSPPCPGDRYPLKTTSNTAHARTGHPSHARKPAREYRRADTDFGARSLPVRQPLTVSDYYNPIGDASPPRPRSAEPSHLEYDDPAQPRRPSDYYVDESADSTGVAKVRHLDDYWLPADRAVRAASDRPRVARGTVRVCDPHSEDNTLCDDLDSKLNISRDSQSSMVKRKISRKMADGSSRVFEESYATDDRHSDAASESGETAGGRASRPDVYPPRQPPTNPTRVKAISARYDKTVDPVLSAVIWPEPKPIPARNQVKVDPVSRYQQYRQEWLRSQVPEERKHKALRWAVKEQMLYKDVIYEKPQKTYVENKYVVPTDKKRKDLRWRIRADMAAGFMPGGL